MKQHLIRLVSLILALVLMTGMVLPASAADFTCSDYHDCTADGAEIYTVVKDGCPIRKEPHNDGKVVARAESGQLISVKRVFRNTKLRRWCEIALQDGSSLYIYSENCKPHKHSYTTIVKTDIGSIDYCAVCGFAKAEAGGKSATCDLTCVADQAIKGSFSDYNPSFSSIVAQMIVGEVAGPFADGRDLAGDILNGEPGWVIAMDLAAFLPIVGLAKYADEIAIFGKHTDELARAARYTDEMVSAVSKTSSTKLAANMRKAFEETGKDRFYDLSDFVFEGKRNVAAHHIVAGGESNEFAKRSRALLAYAGIDVNDAENGVFLVSNAEYADTAALHTGRHSQEYHQAVHDRLFAAVQSLPASAGDADAARSMYRTQILHELDSIAEDLMNGDLLLN